MTEHGGDNGTHNLPSAATQLFSNSEIEALKQELTALHDIIGAIHASERSCADIEPAWKRKSAIVEKLQKENRRVLQCTTILEEVRRWRDQRARIKTDRK